MMYEDEEIRQRDGGGHWDKETETETRNEGEETEKRDEC